jgi:DNA modification methylase
MRDGRPEESRPRTTATARSRYPNAAPVAHDALMPSGDDGGMRDVLEHRRAWAISVAHVLDGLRALPDGCVQTVCTSPPYWGLRAYSTAPVVMGGDPDCDHLLETTPGPVQSGGTNPERSAKQLTNRGGQYGNAWAEQRSVLEQGNKRKPSDDGIAGRDRSTDKAVPVLLERTSATCTRCGAWRGELGSEPTPQLFVAHLVAVFRELRRVLRDDGTVWLNIADSYAGGKRGRDDNSAEDRGRFDAPGHGGGVKVQATGNNGVPRPVPPGYQAKSLCLIPERLALALSDDGWIIRSHIVWAKLAPMPESATDRPTSAWEHVWLLTKRGRYWYDAEAVRQPAEYGRREWVGNGSGWSRSMHGDPRDTRTDGPLTVRGADASAGANLRNVWTLSPEPYDAEYCTACGGYYAGAAKSAIRTRTVEGARRRLCPCGRHDAWLSHFATFPSELPRRAILAGTSAHGACPTCGAGWKRTTARGALVAEAGYENSHRLYPKGATATELQHRGANWIKDGFQPNHRYEQHTTGWVSTCTCNDPRPLVPCLVLDPFSGSGTSILVAHQLGRRAIGIELSAPYAAMSRARISQDAPLVEAVAAAVPWAQGGLFGEEEA